MIIVVLFSPGHTMILLIIALFILCSVLSSCLCARFLTVQVIEDNGVRRVVVVPQAPEFHPGGHAVIHRPPHPPLPGFLPLPAMIPPPPRHIYSPVTGAGDMATQYIPQYHTSQMYGDLGM